MRARRPASTLRRPIWWSLAGRPAKRTRKKRYYAVLESTARSPGGSSAPTHHLEPPQTLTAVLMIIGLLAQWHASNAHFLQSTPLVTAAPIAFLPRADSLCSHAGLRAPLCLRLQLFSAQPSERHTLHNPQHFCLFRGGKHYTEVNAGLQQANSRGCLSIRRHLPPFHTHKLDLGSCLHAFRLQNGCCRPGNITFKG